jgi:hypothetical protein
MTTNRNASAKANEPITDVIELSAYDLHKRTAHCAVVAVYALYASNADSTQLQHSVYYRRMLLTSAVVGSTRSNLECHSRQRA